MLTSYERGARASIPAQVPAVDVAHISQHVLANVGLLQAPLWTNLGADETEVVQVSMVTQVSPSADGILMRSIFDPLE